MRIPRRSRTFDSLPERTLVSGKGKANPISRLSERSLVRKIAGSLSVHEDDGLESVQSLSGMSESAATLSYDTDMSSDSSRCGIVGCHPVEEDSPCSLPLGLSATAALLHRKELAVDELLGVGTFSQVFALSSLKLKKAYHVLAAQEGDPAARRQLQHTKPGQLVVKHLNRRLLQRPKQFFQAALHLEREATILGQVQHPNIVQLRAVALGGTTALQSGHYNDYFLVLDRLQGTLDERIEYWRSSGNDASCSRALYAQKIRYSLQIASALHYLHSHRLIYRDVKASNCGFLPDGTLQLFDFGFCRALPPSYMGYHNDNDDQDNETFHMSLAGTTRYMAPEILQEKTYNAKADVYSFAMTVYEMMTHEKPYGDIRAHHFFECVCTNQVRPNLKKNKLPFAAAALQTLLENAWCANVTDRWSIGTVMERLRDIQCTLQQEPSNGCQRASCQRCSSPKAA
ncbi:SPS1-related proline-alanine-rich protein kinase [Seminavis robusta]|uniref:SPS1-related proline-alanine-rich protein kinase n=1 Tax=Seminavis robusta TaxID=568900 RepID=A0A9N8HT59_9STRA|nr:SPS1-related proline-alanine-rich protein kinase [Seminavis robusta]|eukprot:Sro1536_g280590.1 SPS1-related proline-alanine-rich protein kinase (457) ;mRNA; f:6738-8108